MPPETTLETFRFFSCLIFSYEYMSIFNDRLGGNAPPVIVWNLLCSKTGAINMMAVQRGKRIGRNDSYVQQYQQDHSLTLATSDCCKSIILRIKCLFIAVPTIGISGILPRSQSEYCLLRMNRLNAIFSISLSHPRFEVNRVSGTDRMINCVLFWILIKWGTSLALL